MLVDRLDQTRVAPQPLAQTRQRMVQMPHQHGVVAPQVGFDGRADLGPDAVEIGPHIVALHDAILHRIDVARELGVLPQALDELDDPGVKLAADRVLRLRERRLNLLDQLQRELVGQRVRHLVDVGDGVDQRGRLGPLGARELQQPRGDERADLRRGEVIAQLGQRAVEHILMATGLGHDVEHRSGGRGGVPGECAGDEEFADGAAHGLLVEQGQRLDRHRADRAGDLREVAGLTQPLAEALGGVEDLELAEQDFGVEEVVADELGEAVSDAVLALRDERGVRDRQAERMPEQRDDREPVGQAADGGGLAEGFEPGPGTGSAHHEAEAEAGQGQQQAAEGDQLHAAERGDTRIGEGLRWHRRKGAGEVPGERGCGVLSPSGFGDYLNSRGLNG